MKWNRGDLTWIKIKNEFIQVRIIKEVKPYHGSHYYHPNQTRYFIELRTSINGCSRLENNTFSEIELIAWDREYKLNTLGM
jgi:hypothetical protein